MADDLDALRTINADVGDLDVERAARLRARALATVLDAVEPTTEPVAEPSTRPGAPATGRHAAPHHRRRAVRHPEPSPRPDGAPVELDLAPVVALDRAAGGGRSRRRPFVVVAAAAAAILAVVIGLGVARSNERAPVMADQPAPVDVRAVADNAAGLADRPLGPGEYSRLAYRDARPSADLGGSPVTHIQDHDLWSAVDGTGQEHTSDITVLDPSGNVVETMSADRTNTFRAGSLGFLGFGYDELRNLPTEPAALRDALAGKSNDTDDHAMADTITRLLLLDTPPPAVRAAAIRLLSDMGATLVPEATDPRGHDGLGIVLPTSDGTTTVFVVTRDGTLLGAYAVATDGPLDPSGAVTWMSLERQERATTLGG